MTTATVTDKGQVTLPKRLRTALGINRGDKLLFELDGEELRVRVVRSGDVGALFDELPGVDTYAGEEAETEAAKKGFAGK